MVLDRGSQSASSDDKGAPARTYNQSPSIDDRLAITKNHPSGFDYLRINLALLILADHTAIVCFGNDMQTTLFQGITRPFLLALVPIFFALSGFLVASSLVRSRSLITFVGLRVLRIVPALTVDTLFCALVLGVLLTDLPLKEYFQSHDFFKYFLNIVGDIHYNLPGVFTHNPSHAVNSQLWTIPYELKCYAVLTAAALIGLHRRPLLLLVATCIVVLGTMIYVTYRPVEITDAWQLLVPSFLLGVCAFSYRDKLPWSPLLAALSFGCDDRPAESIQCFDDFSRVPHRLFDCLDWTIKSATWRHYPFRRLLISAVPLQFSDPANAGRRCARGSHLVDKYFAGRADHIYFCGTLLAFGGEAGAGGTSISLRF